MENVIIGTKENVEGLISSDKVTILDFGRPLHSGCGACDEITKFLEQLVMETPNLQLVKINTDVNMELCLEYSIRAVPKLFIFQNGIRKGEL